MTTQAPVAGSQSPKLTISAVTMLLLGALVIFAAAYGVAAVFGRDADDEVTDLDARVVPAMPISGTPLLTVTARAVAFDTKEITVRAGEPAQIRLDNFDAGINHNIAVYRDEEAGDLVIRGKLFDGPDVRDYVFEGMTPGTYHFQCDLHPAMSGVFIVQ
ncbi:MAG: cupredoxin domain-containing protein [Dehalococcoidia bacterium]